MFSGETCTELLFKTCFDNTGGHTVSTSFRHGLQNFPITNVLNYTNVYSYTYTCILRCVYFAEIASMRLHRTDRSPSKGT